MNALIPAAWAQATPGAPGGQFQFALLMAAFIALFYFMLIRPQQKRAKEHQALVSKLATGDEVVTTGGLLGRVTWSDTGKMRDAEELVLRPTTDGMVVNALFTGTSTTRPTARSIDIEVSDVTGAPLGSGSAEATVHCPTGDAATFCQRICSG